MRLRPPAPVDAAAVLAVLQARDVADLGEPDFTLGDLRDAWSAPGFDLASDAVVVEDDDGAIVACAQRQGTGVLVSVHPDAEGRGIGTRLLGWAEALDAGRGHALHRQAVGLANERGIALLTRAGYARARASTRLQRDLDEDAGAPVEPPAGVVLRALDPRADAEALHALSDAAFAANADWEPESLEEFRAEHLRSHDLDPGLSCVAQRGGRIAGMALVRRWEDGRGYVDLLAVDPGEARRGLGRALLEAVFARARTAGLSAVTLSVASDNPRALRLYERAGMRARWNHGVYEKPRAR